MILPLSIFLIGLLAHAAAQETTPTRLEKEVLEEINIARTEPQWYLSFLQEWKRHYEGNFLHLPGELAVRTQEGVAAADEAIAFLRRIRPRRPLRYSRGMSRAARDHVRDTGPGGQVSHVGSDGSEVGDRLNRHGRWKRKIGENIAFGSDKARWVVLGLIVDDGVPDRGHRTVIFEPDFRRAGVACGPHRVYETMCVITFAAGYEEK